MVKLPSLPLTDPADVGLSAQVIVAVKSAVVANELPSVKVASVPPEGIPTVAARAVTVPIVNGASATSTELRALADAARHQLRRP